MGDRSDSSIGAEIRLLGPLEVLVDGVPVAAGGPRQRALLALLALSAGTAVPPSRLIDLLWDDEPPPTAANTVQVYVSRLRRLLAGQTGASPLRTVAGMYLLDLPPEAVDARRFESLSEAGRARLAAGDAAGAATDLRAALGLWRGAALPDLDGTTAAQPAVARLESVRLATLADRIDADALLGRHPTLIAELEGLVLRYPFDERFVGQLMTALYRSGRQAEAFAAYTMAADRLAEELGVDPGPALRALRDQVLRQDAALAPPVAPVASSPVFLSSGVALSNGSALSSGSVSGSASPFVGRRIELATARELIGQPDVRLVTVLGPGGAGKTRLAEQVAAAPSVDPGVDPAGESVRVVFVRLAAMTDGSQLPAEICRLLAIEPDWIGEPALDVAGRALSGGPVLLILDNLEQLVGGDLSAITELLARLPRLTVLTTSRTVLRLPGERLLVLGPLPLPLLGPDGADDVNAVLAADAVQLFRERARAVLPSFEVTPANAVAVATLCRSLDGLPLALELAAARVRVLPPEEILRRLDRRMELLAGGAEHLPERQRSMWAALDWSARLLDPAELTLFGQLSVFAGGWTLDAAEQVALPSSAADPGREQQPLVIDALSRLVDKSLVVADGTGRFGMLETVRDYARDVLSADPALAAATHDRHAAHYAALAEELGPQSRGWLSTPGVSPRSRLDREVANFAAALEHAAGTSGDVGSENGELLGRLVVGLLDYWFAAGRLREVDRWLQAAKRATLAPALRARVLLSFGNLAVVGGDLQAATVALAEAHEVAARFGDLVLIIRSSAARAVVARYLGHPEQSLVLLDAALEALAIGADVPGLDRLALERALQNELGEVLDELDRTAEAVELWQECQRWAAATENPGQLAYPLVNLARSALGRGETVEALALMDGALAAAAASESAPVLADVIASAGMIDHRTGHRERATARLRQAIRLGHDCGQLLSLPEMVVLLGAALVPDDPAVGARLLGAAEAWRASRSIAPWGRSTRAVVVRAEALLAGGLVADGIGPDDGTVLTAEQVEAERRRGARTPFGSLRGLVMLDPRLSSAVGVIDLTSVDVVTPAGQLTAERPR